MPNSLNPQQLAAVHHVSSPLLVLAGAGSGKTRVITRKIAHLVQQKHFSAQHITAVTFTNKAAREMQERVRKLLPQEQAEGLQVSTFHTLGLKILRNEYKRVGLRRGFTIYDTQDSTALLRELLRKEFGVKPEEEDRLRWRISEWKNAYCSPQQALAGAREPADFHAAQLYTRYDHFLRTYNAVDFDDLIVLPTRLLQEDADVLAAWQERIRYLLVDEYQDTNTAQYEFVRLLVGRRGNLTVVGDDDQSVYGWRGAQPENLGLLQKDFPDLRVIKLEQNYRSVSNILQAANALIAHNPHAYEKKLWSALGQGESIRILQSRNADHEAERVVSQILHHRFKTGGEYGQYAILYRGNHQSRPFERALRDQRIPYHLSGGTSFFERTEIKDLMAYLRLLVNPDDDAAFLRAINTPRRGLGPTTLEQLANFAQSAKLSLFASLFDTGLDRAVSRRASDALQNFAHWINDFAFRIEKADPLAAIHDLLDDIQYRSWIESQSPDPQSAERRWENVVELLDWLKRIQRDKSGQDLSQWLSHMALMDMLDRDSNDDSGNVVHLMTLHAAKGLEFDHVYIVGMEEELLPHKNSLQDALEEERRLAYVGITRARRSLTFTCAMTRRRFGELLACEPSRFLSEIPAEFLLWEDQQEITPEERKERGNAHLAHLRNLLTS